MPLNDKNAPTAMVVEALFNLCTGHQQSYRRKAGNRPAENGDIKKETYSKNLTSAKVKYFLDARCYHLYPCLVCE